MRPAPASRHIGNGRLEFHKRLLTPASSIDRPLTHTQLSIDRFEPSGARLSASDDECRACFLVLVEQLGQAALLRSERRKLSPCRSFILNLIGETRDLLLRVRAQVAPMTCADVEQLTE